ncbi:hypothetical protein Q5P01_020570 [Channa striata]|uniref:Uncharacterized protein n=1 Tax=Channa striata TaxID=64152 RepID=A0AA88LXW1_CHASR|nr:hypothetical protein Q5P01_020570 [Channa striata]
MLISQGFQSALSPVIAMHWPVHSLQVKPLLYQKHLLQKRSQEVHNTLELMDKFQHKIVLKIKSFQTAAAAGLSVTQGSKKLRVKGKMEKKQEEGKFCYSYRCEESRQDFDLPDS